MTVERCRAGGEPVEPVAVELQPGEGPPPDPALAVRPGTDEPEHGLADADDLAIDREAGPCPCLGRIGHLQLDEPRLVPAIPVGAHLGDPT
jgi:hypothetical protein